MVKRGSRAVARDDFDFRDQAGADPDWDEEEVEDEEEFEAAVGTTPRAKRKARPRRRPSDNEGALYRSLCPSCQVTYDDGRAVCPTCNRVTAACHGEQLVKSLSALEGIVESAARVSIEPDDDAINAEASTDRPNDEVVEVFGRSYGPNERPDPQDEGLALAQALIDGHNYHVTLSRHVARDVRRLRRELGVVARALHSIGAVVKSLVDQSNAVLGHVPTGPRSVRSAPVPQTEQPRSRYAHLRGEDLVVKATMAGMTIKDGRPLLAAVDVGAIRQWASQGASLADLYEHDPERASRLEWAISQLEQSSH